MSKSLKLYAAAILSFAVAACGSDVTTAPISAAGLSPALSANGVGNAHFVTDSGATTCTLDFVTYLASCTYKTAGLANGATVTIDASSAVTIEYSCVTPSGHTPPHWQNLMDEETVTFTVTKGNLNGNLQGTFTLDLSGPSDTDALCPSPKGNHGVQYVYTTTILSAGWSIAASGSNGRTGFSIPTITGSWLQ